jgi:hypothetical protein
MLVTIFTVHITATSDRPHTLAVFVLAATPGGARPRLVAAQQPSCHEQVPAGDIEDQTFGTGQIGRRYFADGYFAEDKPNPMSAVWDRFRAGPFSPGAYRPL